MNHGHRGSEFEGRQVRPEVNLRSSESLGVSGPSITADCKLDAHSVVSLDTVQRFQVASPDHNIVSEGIYMHMLWKADTPSKLCRHRFRQALRIDC
jgi:hypothetical protein